MTIVKIDTNRITDWDTFHSVFAEEFGFPDFYGRNMDAWIDCMTYLDEPSAGMTRIHTTPGSVVTLHLENVDDFARRCPEQYREIVECTAFVNGRRIEMGGQPVLALSFLKSPTFTQLEATDEDLKKALAEFACAFEVVFGQDWDYTRCMLRNPSQGDILPEGTTFIKPIGVSLDHSNWGARAALIRAHRRLLDVMSRKGLQPSLPLPDDSYVYKWPDA